MDELEDLRERRPAPRGMESRFQAVSPGKQTQEMSEKIEERIPSETRLNVAKQFSIQDLWKLGENSLFVEILENHGQFRDYLHSRLSHHDDIESINAYIDHLTTPARNTESTIAHEENPLDASSASTQLTSDRTIARRSETDADGLGDVAGQPKKIDPYLGLVYTALIEYGHQASLANSAKVFSGITNRRFVQGVYSAITASAFAKNGYSGIPVPRNGTEGELIIRNDPNLKEQGVPENEDAYLRKSNGAWEVLAGENYQRVKFSPDAATEAEHLYRIHPNLIHFVGIMGNPEINNTQLVSARALFTAVIQDKRTDAGGLAKAVGGFWELVKRQETDVDGLADISAKLPAIIQDERTDAGVLGNAAGVFWGIAERWDTDADGLKDIRTQFAAIIQDERTGAGGLVNAAGGLWEIVTRPESEIDDLKVARTLLGAIVGDKRTDAEGLANACGGFGGLVNRSGTDADGIKDIRTQLAAIVADKRTDADGLSKAAGLCLDIAKRRRRTANDDLKDVRTQLGAIVGDKRTHADGLVNAGGGFWELVERWQTDADGLKDIRTQLGVIVGDKRTDADGLANAAGALWAIVKRPESDIDDLEDVRTLLGLIVGDKRTDADGLANAAGGFRAIAERPETKADALKDIRIQLGVIVGDERTDAVGLANAAGGFRAITERPETKADALKDIRIQLGVIVEDKRTDADGLGFAADGLGEIARKSEIDAEELEQVKTLLTTIVGDIRTDKGGIRSAKSLLQAIKRKEKLALYAKQPYEKTKFDERARNEHSEGEKLSSKQSEVWNRFCSMSVPDQIAYFNDPSQKQWDLHNIPNELQKMRYENALDAAYFLPEYSQYRHVPGKRQELNNLRESVHDGKYPEKIGNMPSQLTLEQQKITLQQADSRRSESRGTSPSPSPRKELGPQSRR